jgi:DNA invertase Pin-like site-specific DNA recombinase
MSKIKYSHLERYAYIYLRQSTQFQVMNNTESQRQQYGLKKRARALGFNEIIIIDEDLGKSGSGTAVRSGFEKLLSEICKGEVGAVFALEASRLARNGREWHTLLELCGLVDTLIIDHDGVYDTKLTNDRLLLGMKGTLSEMELSTMRVRAHEALKNKAKRGELLLTVAVGYVKSKDNRIEKDPDKRVREAIKLVFKKFTELGSARQVIIWFRRNNIKLPKVFYGLEGRYLRWELPAYTTIIQILRNPIYAGAYAYGRKYYKITIENGRKRKTIKRERDPKKWKVLIKEHHECYIIWDEYQKNQEILDNNANARGELVRGSVRPGRGLLVGLLRCGHCGRRLHVSYGSAERYICQGNQVCNGDGKCISFGAYHVNKAVVRIVLDALSPLGMEASILAVERLEEKNSDVKKQLELALKQARYEAQRAERQYNSVEPENRLIASELESRWNEALLNVQKIEERIADIPEVKRISEKEKEELICLGKDIEYVWNHEDAPLKLKKRILRTVLKEIMVTVEEGYLNLILHWQGGEHTKTKVKKLKHGEHRWKTDVETIDIIKGLSRIMKDKEIASLLNRLGKRTVKGHTWKEGQIVSFRSVHKIPRYRKGEIEDRGEMKVIDVVKELNVSPRVVYRLIKKNILPAKQICKGAPWIIRMQDLKSEKVMKAVNLVKEGKKIPLHDNQPELFTYNIDN